MAAGTATGMGPMRDQRELKTAWQEERGPQPGRDLWVKMRSSTDNSSPAAAKTSKRIIGFDGKKLRPNKADK
jgi:hypothetical protein